MRTAPSPVRHARDRAAALGITTRYDSFCVQLGRWTREGLLNEVADATYPLSTAWLLAVTTRTARRWPAGGASS
ncbi:hypothetical protein [Streptomyces sp. NPDC054783]